MVAIFFQSLLIGYSGAMMPGSLLVYTMDKSMKTGARAGLLISIGHALLELLVVALLFMGVGTILKTEAAQTVIGIVGGFILFLIGINMLWAVHTRKINIEVSQSEARSGNMLLGGAVLSASNPYFSLWWSVVGLGLLMKAYDLFGMAGVISFYAGHILADISWFTFVAALIGKTKRFMNLKVYQYIVVFLGLCVVGFGMIFFVSAIKKIV